MPFADGATLIFGMRLANVLLHGLCFLHKRQRAKLTQEAVGLGIRATFATWLLWKGVDLRTVQDWMGHTDIESTMRYLKPNRSQAVRQKVNETFA